MRLLIAAMTMIAALSVAGPLLAQRTPPPGASGHTDMSPAESNARQALEGSGYTQVRDVKASPKGVTAKAVKDGKDVSVVVDPAGKVEELQPRQ